MLYEKQILVILYISISSLFDGYLTGNIYMNENDLRKLLERLLLQTNECEWLEFKHNFHSEEEIGERISALANGACLSNQQYGYLIFGVEDSTHEVVGTNFSFVKHKKGNEELENWLLQRLSPRLDIWKYELDYDGKKVIIIEIPSAYYQPVRFSNIAYIRIGSITRKLRDFSDKERKIWDKFNEKGFEKETALREVYADEIIKLLDTQTFFELIKLSYPSTREAVIAKLISYNMIKASNYSYDIQNLGAILLAKNLNDFPSLSRKMLRVIVYRTNNRIETIREQEVTKGYAVGFAGIVNWINDQLPANEEIGKALRTNVRMYPEIAIRELVANTIIHQDFQISGSGPIIEIFNDRIEFTNPGLPLITTNRFIDEFQSRNEDLAKFMRLVGICEEKGSGIDKVISNVELYQLPAPDFVEMEKHTKVKLFAYLDFKNMDKKDKIRACYQHACLKYVSNEKMTNQSLRERFKIDDKNSAIASRIIKDTTKLELVKEDDPDSKSKKHIKYIPYWA